MAQHASGGRNRDQRARAPDPEPQISEQPLGEAAPDCKLFDVRSVVKWATVFALCAALAAAIFACRKSHPLAVNASGKNMPNVLDKDRLQTTRTEATNVDPDSVAVLPFANGVEMPKLTTSATASPSP